jgi:hypothetical protein
MAKRGTSLRRYSWLANGISAFYSAHIPIFYSRDKNSHANTKIMKKQRTQRLLRCRLSRNVTAQYVELWADDVIPKAVLTPDALVCAGVDMQYRAYVRPVPAPRSIGQSVNRSNVTSRVLDLVSVDLRIRLRQTGRFVRQLIILVALYQIRQIFESDAIQKEQCLRLKLKLHHMYFYCNLRAEHEELDSALRSNMSLWPWHRCLGCRTISAKETDTWRQICW